MSIALNVAAQQQSPLASSSAGFGASTSLAVEGKVAASTQNQALSALLFLYGEVLEVDLPWMDEIRPRQAPAAAQLTRCTL